MNWPLLVTRNSVLTWLGLFLCTAHLFAQAGVQDEAPPPAVPAATESVSESNRDPAVFYLRDKQGNLILVPDFSFEKWEQLTKLERNLLPASPPPHRFLEPVQLRGELHGSYLLVSARCNFRLNDLEASSETTDANWFRIPLRFDQAIRTPAFEHTGAGEVFWQLDAEAEGHILWLRARPGSEHEVSWTMKVPLVRRRDLAGFAVRAPSTSFRLEMTIAGDDIETFQGPTSESIVTTETTGDGSTRLTVEGAGGDLQLNWRARGAVRPLLDAQGTMNMRLIGGEVETTANLLVRSHAEPVTSFLVRLPPGSELLPLPSSDLDIQPELGELTEQTGSVLRVSRRDGRAASEFEVVLQTLRPASKVASPAEHFQTAGFEVLGAVRQSGVVDFEVDGEWTADWQPGPYVRRERVATEVASSANPTARFVYNRQPFSLKVAVTRRVSLISVEPTHLIEVRARQLRLESRLSYRFSGSRAKILRVQMPGWEVVEDVQPLEAVESSELVDGRLSIYLSPDSDSDLELRLTARRTIRDSGSVTFQLPKPNAASAAPATVAILPADNVQLSPRDEELVGLITESLPIGIPIPQRQQPALTYRGEVNAPLTVFAADMEVLQRRVSVSVESELVLAANHLEVEQLMDYTIQHEPVNQLRLQIPELLAETGEWEVTIDGAQLPVVLLSDAPLDATDVETTPPRPVLVVTLRDPKIGQLLLSLQYRLALERDFHKSQSTVLVLGLAQPADDEFTEVVENTMRMSASDFFDSKQVDRRWEVVPQGVEESSLSGTAAEPMYRALGRIESVTTEVVVARLQEEETLALEKVWLQSWLTGEVRRDRASFQFRTDRNGIDLSLPAGVEQVKLSLDGAHQTPGQVSDELLRIDLDDSMSVRSHILEVWYWSTPADASLKRIPARMPRIVGADRADRLFWQLVLPSNEHLLWSPQELTTEFIWQRNGLYWGRKPNRSQRQLETLLGASTQDAIPASTNQYLFSSVGPLQPIEFYAVRRTLLVMGISLVVLVVGLLLIYFPPLRHPTVLLTVGVLVFGLSLAFAEVAILVGQAAGLGLALVLTARLLQWTISVRPRQSAAMATTLVRAGSEREIRTPPPEPGSSRITTISPTSFPLSATETEP